MVCMANDITDGKEGKMGFKKALGIGALVLGGALYFSSDGFRDVKEKATTGAVRTFDAALYHADNALQATSDTCDDLGRGCRRYRRELRENYSEHLPPQSMPEYVRDRVDELHDGADQLRQNVQEW